MSSMKEKDLEDSICAHLAAHGWLYSQDDTGYDRDLALYPPDLFDFIAETQPDTWARLVDPTASSSTQQNRKARLLRAVVAQLDNPNPALGGTVTTLRKGLTDPLQGKVHLAYPRPLTDKNPEAARQYAAMRVRVMRQVHLANGSMESVDLVFFVNGIPTATVELKTDMTQAVENAVKQYRLRNPRSTPLFGHGTRAVVHFAVSDREAWMTTRLERGATTFLPFNLGHGGGAGNPPNPGGSATAYLWERVFEKDAWLGILQNFVFTEEKSTTDPETGRVTRRRRLIFPRFHQWEAVTRILEDAAEHGAGKRYLIEHSAGSGKTNTIAWTAHRLLRLHRAGEKVFDSVIVVTDRTVLDSQLQRAVLAIETTPGTVVAVNDRTVRAGGHTSKSQMVAQVLSHGNRIVVVTLQTFPSVLEALKDDPALAGRRFAVIADEAHSSQTGASAAKLRRVLTPAEQADLADGGTVDVEAVLAAELETTGPAPSVSFLAFTATPKPKTMELFGRAGQKRDDGDKPVPESFHRYPMKQAIEEGFILDVLKNYTTYQTAFQLARLTESGGLEEFQLHGRGRGGASGAGAHPGASDDVDQEAAAAQLRRWVKLHPDTIAQKVEIIVEHFRSTVAHLLDGQAKAMVVTDSRLAALRYKHAMDDYLAEQGYTDLGALVAFSGTVQDPDTPGVDPVTEAQANPGAPADLAAALDSDDYAVMIVANKFQTGFDQPKLSALYVDKKLDGVLAVQTLSRLNRTIPGKKTRTYVLDFVNTEEDILGAFAPYYEGAELEKVTDPRRLSEVMLKLDASGLYTPEELDAFVAALVVGEGEQTLKGLLWPAVARFEAEVADARERGDSPRVEELALQRKDVRTYLKLYDFLAQVYRLAGTDYLRHAYYLRALDALLPSVGPGTEVVDISDVRLVAIRQDELGTSDLRVTETVPLTPAEGAGSGMVREKHRGPLDEVIDRLNEAFAGAGFELQEADTLTRRTVERVVAREEIRSQAQDNTEAQFVGGGEVDSAITLAMWELVQHRAGMSEFLNRDGEEQRAMRADFARAVWRAVQAEVGERGGTAAPSTLSSAETHSSTVIDR